jgi:phosphopantetheine adenylyltransferase/dephospho-CoA kinase
VFPGTECYKKLIEEFDDGNLVDATGRIDRKVLGQKVFQNPENLSKLESLVWPEIWRLTMDKADRLFKEGKKVVVLDAAVLIKAGWDKEMHQVRFLFRSKGLKCWRSNFI